MKCRLCDSDRMLSVLDLGATPPCEKILSAAELDLPEPTYPLHLRLCEDCLLLQIPALITPEETFTEYAYYSSYSDSWVQHAGTFVAQAVERLGLGPDSFVVEAASNDGYLLQHAVARGIPCLGIEPSLNVGAAAVERGVPTVSEFLDQDLARRVRAEHGPANLVVANNVYAHIPDLRGFTQSLRGLLADDGWLSIEVHHALNLVCLGQFDTIYHEHFQYYTVFSAQNALASAGLAVVDVEMLPTHGGSIRVWARPIEVAGPPTDRVAKILRIEEAAGLHRPEGYRQLRQHTEQIRHDLLRFLLECKAEGKRVVGYGAPGKGNTLLNYCGIRTDLLEYTVDRNPYKHGHFTPGTRIPIHAPDLIAQDRPDVVLVLPWNLETEITEQLSYVTEWGGQIVYPLPSLHWASNVKPRSAALA
ncbi:MULTISPECIES: class I SAM-dependent methyltransferase [Mycobacterium]|uniref:Methyltransferase n=1 Tax=Mycobacterium kiyosense TaxID=2871094 RepID=A0A9P3UV34_9MYCO|nr:MULTISPECIES: class I SAM-dependent methyltransferase [Mycobacterium]BDB44720.1 methyltransferase [Mycobacterium kiyosense]BDE16216.1 methyltransferase [Mycobacterium sp. 20KCMC460]GLB82113.1 methyltransferase [Mycobacterium kiyosense]GLB90596.1 methyltransferase [Mycobacterium kiyosense]GLB95255.1 methyltransferase [Mycobacterium kiyosense]